MGIGGAMEFRFQMVAWIMCEGAGSQGIEELITGVIIKSPSKTFCITVY